VIGEHDEASTVTVAAGTVAADGSGFQVTTVVPGVARRLDESVAA
jgi:hypothetical protein